MREQRDGSTAGDGDTADRYVVERQVLYGQPPDERNYQVVWAIWDRRLRAFLATLFASREEAERHAARLRADQS